jgi:hypothetical protein
LPELQRPDVKINVLRGKRLAEEIEDIAKRQGIDLSLANMEQTKEILKSSRSSLSDEIVSRRKLID